MGGSLKHHAGSWVASTLAAGLLLAGIGCSDEPDASVVSRVSANTPGTRPSRAVIEVASNQRLNKLVVAPGPDRLYVGTSGFGNSVLEIPNDRRETLKLERYGAASELNIVGKTYVDLGVIAENGGLLATAQGLLFYSGDRDVVRRAPDGRLESVLHFEYERVDTFHRLQVDARHLYWLSPAWPAIPWKLKRSPLSPVAAGSESPEPETLLEGRSFIESDRDTRVSFRTDESDDVFVLMANNALPPDDRALVRVSKSGKADGVWKLSSSKSTAMHLTARYVVVNEGGYITRIDRQTGARVALNATALADFPAELEGNEENVCWVSDDKQAVRCLQIDRPARQVVTIYEVGSELLRSSRETYHALTITAQVSGLRLGLLGAYFAVRVEWAKPCPPRDPATWWSVQHVGKLDDATLAPAIGVTDLVITF